MTARHWCCLIPNQADWLFFNPSFQNICPTSGDLYLSAESEVLNALSPSNFLTENPVWSQTAAAFMFYFINNLRACIRCWSVPSTRNKVSSGFAGSQTVFWCLETLQKQYCSVIYQPGLLVFEFITTNMWNVCTSGEKTQNVPRINYFPSLPFISASYFINVIFSQQEIRLCYEREKNT